VGPPQLVELTSSGTNGWRLDTMQVFWLAPPDTAAVDATTTFTTSEWLGSGGNKALNLTSQSSTPGETDCPPCHAQTRGVSTLSSTFIPVAYGLALQYGTTSAFRLWVDCARRGAYRFEYNASHDCGCLDRHSSFKLDPEQPPECQQYNGNTYPKIDSGGVENSYDRGHLVPANHLDGDAVAISQSNFMTNILPQVANMNRGSWLATEEIVECFRDVEPLHVLGGAVYNSSDPRNAWFIPSHGVPNPEYFWKVITASSLFPEDHHRIAFWIPNSKLAVRGELDEYVVSLQELETKLNAFGQPQEFVVAAQQKLHKPAAAWTLPVGCDKGR